MQVDEDNDVVAVAVEHFRDAVAAVQVLIVVVGFDIGVVGLWA